MTDPRRFALLAVAAAFSVALATVYWVSWHSPGVGLYHDDGVYLVTAKALAEGRGYQLISLPSEIPQTKYPFLFPAVLAALMKISPRFPENIVLLKALPLLCSLLWLVFLWKLLIRLGARNFPALWIVLLTAACPLTIFLSTNLMSEPLFALLCTGSLLAATAVEDGASPRLAFVSGALAGLAFLTRSIGIAILIAPALAFVIQKRIGPAVRFCVAGLLIGCVWPIWARLHWTAPDPAQAYYSAMNYASGNIVFALTWPEKLRVLGTNSLLAVGSPLTLFQLPLAGVWLLTLSLIFIAFALYFGRVSAVYLFVVVYTGISVIRVWPPERFLQVILPFSLFFLWKVADAKLPARLAKIVPVLLVSALSANLLYLGISRIPATNRDGTFSTRGRADSWTQILSVTKWIGENTKPTDVILANLDPVVYLFSGRKAIRDFVSDSYKLFYSAGGPPGDSLSPLEETIAATRADFLVLMPDREFVESPVMRKNVSSFLNRYPDRLRRVDRPAADPEYVIYRIIKP